jgi:DNA topoisomerase-3
MANNIQTLWIPEKPKVAKELVAAIARVKGAKVTNSATVVKDGFYKLSSGDVVCSVFGHMLQMAPPSRYFTKEQNADPMPHLPLVPNPFRFEPNYERNQDGSIQERGGKPVVSKRFVLLEKLIKQADVIVNGCDIDREGQLIFDELLAHVGRDPGGPKIKRASIVSMMPDALDESVIKLDLNSDKKWALRGDAAATRQKMDWLLGMNASMAYQAVTGIRTMSVGRVQTPVLAMVVRRDLEIENFKPQIYYVPIVIMADGTRMRWEKRHDAEGQPGFDANGRIIDLKLAQGIVEQIKAGLPGTVTIATQEEKKEAPPLPFSMGSLQSEAAKRHGLTVAQVTKAAQNLYEKHKAITYVGTDCRFLPEKMHDDAFDVLRGLSGQFEVQAAGANPKIKSKAFNDKKVDEHFAIVPTGSRPSLSASESAERMVFETIATRYMAQFYPDYRALKATLAVVFGKDEFRANASKDLELGWKQIEGNKAKGERSSVSGQDDEENHQQRHSNKG